MADRYQRFADLAAGAREGTDYRIRLEDRGSPVVILAPHGGYIEPETERVAEAIAGQQMSFYAFETLEPGPHGDFHITSHLFDEPRAVALVGGAQSSVAIHGRKDDGTDTVWMGGRDTVLGAAIAAALHKAGFGAERNKTLPGVHVTNICNRTKTGKGVQLELSRALRRKLAERHDLLDTFCTAVRQAVLARYG